MKVVHQKFPTWSFFRFQSDWC